MVTIPSQTSGDPLISEKMPSLKEEIFNLFKDNTSKKLYSLGTAFLEVLTTIVLISSYLYSAFTLKPPDDGSVPSRTFFGLDRLTGLTYYIIPWFIFVILTFLRGAIKTIFPNKGNTTTLSRKEMKIRCILKFICQFKLVIIAFQFTCHSETWKFHYTLPMLLIEICSEGWNKSYTLRKSALTAFLGSWYPECIYQLSFPERYSKFGESRLTQGKTRIIAILYITFSMGSLVFQDSITFYSGVVLVAIWAVTGDSEITQGAYRVLNNDRGQAFNMVLLWHVTIVYCATCLNCGTFGAIKFLLKFLVNFIKKQKFCCPVSRNLKMCKRVFVKAGLSKGKRVDFNGSEIDYGSIDMSYKQICVGKKSQFGANGDNMFIQLRRKAVSDNEGSAVPHDSLFDIKLRNEFEELELLSVDADQVDKVAYSYKEGVPLVTSLKDMQAVYFAHCDRLRSIVSDLHEFELRELDKHAIVGSWTAVTPEIMSFATNRKLSEKWGFYKMLIISAKLLGVAYMDLCGLLYLGANEKAIRELIGNKKSKIFYNSWKTLNGVETAFQLPTAFKELLKDISKMKVVVDKGAKETKITNDETNEVIKIGQCINCDFELQEKISCTEHPETGTEIQEGKGKEMEITEQQPTRMGEKELEGELTNKLRETLKMRTGFAEYEGLLGVKLRAEITERFSNCDDKIKSIVKSILGGSFERVIYEKKEMIKFIYALKNATKLERLSMIASYKAGIGILEGGKLPGEEITTQTFIRGKITNTKLERLIGAAMKSELNRAFSKVILDMLDPEEIKAATAPTSKETYPLKEVYADAPSVRQHVLDFENMVRVSRGEKPLELKDTHSTKTAFLNKVEEKSDYEKSKKIMEEKLQASKEFLRKYRAGTTKIYKIRKKSSKPNEIPSLSELNNKQSSEDGYSKSSINYYRKVRQGLTNLKELSKIIGTTINPIIGKAKHKIFSSIKEGKGVNLSKDYFDKKLINPTIKIMRSTISVIRKSEVSKSTSKSGPVKAEGSTNELTTEQIKNVINKGAYMLVIPFEK